MTKPSFDSFEDKTIFVKSENQDIAPWDRTKIIAILVEESGLSFSVAEKIADDVQKIVFSSNLKIVSTSLLREIVNSKLIEYGYSKILNKTRKLGLSVSDVRNSLTIAMPYRNYTPVSPLQSSFYIADTVKRQFAAEDVFPEKSVNLHYEGKIHINGIDGIDRVFSIVLDLSKILNFSYAGDNFFIKKPSNGREFLNNLIKVLILLQGFVNHSITITGFEKAIMYFGMNENSIVDLILQIENSFIFSKPVKIFLKDSKLVELAAQTYSNGFFLKSEVLTPVSGYCPSRNISIFNRELNTEYIIENITLNLTGIVLSAKLERKDFLSKLRSMLKHVFAVFSRKAVFMEKMLMTKGFNVLEFLKAIGFNPITSSFCVSICGLKEAVSLLREKVKFTDKENEFAFELVSTVKGLINEMAKTYRINVKLCDSDQIDVAYRFARLDLKFEPYYISKIVKGDISSGGVYYSPNASLSSNPLSSERDIIQVEGKIKELFDNPFKTIVKLIDLEGMCLDNTEVKNPYLMLTQDFSVCYHCCVMKSGIYKSCPKCLSADIVNYVYLYSHYAPSNKLNRAVKVMMKNCKYYEQFTI